LIDFTEDMTTRLNNSFKDQMIVMVASASKAGMPDIAFKGSAMAWDKDHIAFWERSLGTTFRNLQENPQACLLYRNFEARAVWKFFGVAEVHAEGPLRQQVMDRTVQQELDRDPERKGAAVIVRVDKIVMGPQVLQER
jgi:predicted pyridoxine 5'-phosphate oxidase superfamily flavin-nucleotide-binding protein